MADIKSLYINTKEVIMQLKNEFPRIINCYIDDNKLYIEYYSVDSIEIWIDNYSKLEKVLKNNFSKYHEDKYYIIKPITTL